MTRDEAARTPGDPAQPGTPGAESTTPGDERPRPRYGEYAPPGWSWTPPEDPHVAQPDPAGQDAAAGVSGAAAPSRWGTPASDATTGSASRSTVAHPIDRAWTLTLLVIGALGAIYNALSLIALPDNVLRSAQLSAEMLGSEAPASFTAGPGAMVAIAIGVVLQLALWTGALVWSRRRLRAGQPAWWVPLAAGAAAFVVVLVVGLVVMASDPVFWATFSTLSAR